MEFYDGDIQVGHPTFAEGSQAATTQQAGTAVEISAPKIVYSKEDDDVIDEWWISQAHRFVQRELTDWPGINFFSLSSANELAFSARTKFPESFYLRVTYFVDLFQTGTCAMKPREQGGVVDARLNVYGVQNLKVAGNDPTTFAKAWYIFELFCPSSDLSIAPGDVGANTYNTAIAVEEKAAFIIAEDLSIKGVTSEWTLGLAYISWNLYTIV